MKSWSPILFWIMVVPITIVLTFLALLLHFIGFIVFNMYEATMQLIGAMTGVKIVVNVKDKNPENDSDSTNFDP